MEIFGTYCHACGFATVLYSALSHKLKKHGYAQKLPLFKANTENQIPYLGVFNYTPAYLYVKKDKKTGQITEIQTLERIFSGQKFIEQVADLSGLPGLRERIGMNTKKIMGSHFNQVTLSDDFDYDSDQVEDEKKSLDDVVKEAKKEA